MKTIMRTCSVWSRNILPTSVICFILSLATHAQTVQQCPENMVCITREAALKAISNADTVKAQDAQIKTLEKAIDDYKAEIQKMREEFIRASSEATALKQNEVRTNAIIDLLLKSTRKKCLPFSVCIGN